MSTAILISGQLRTFARCWPTQRWHVLRHFTDPHFFICVQAQPDWSEILAPLIAEYGQDRVHIDLKGDPDLSEHLTPQLAAAYHQAPYTNAAPAHQLLLQHYYQKEIWKFYNHCIADPGYVPEKFDTVIRMRADLWFHSFDDPLESTITRFSEDGATPNGSVCMRRYIGSREAFTPWWGKFGGINDRFAIMGPEAARYYFTTYDAIPELLAAGCPFHPESLVKANLERGNIDLHETLRTEFSTLRHDGTSRPPEIMGCDIAHASLRAA